MKRKQKVQTIFHSIGVQPNKLETENQDDGTANLLVEPSELNSEDREVSKNKDTIEYFKDLFVTNKFFELIVKKHESFSLHLNSIQKIKLQTFLNQFGI